VEQLTARLSERDEVMSRLRQQSTDTVSALERTHMTELLALKDERDQLQRQIHESRSAQHIYSRRGQKLQLRGGSGVAFTRGAASSLPTS